MNESIQTELSESVWRAGRSMRGRVRAAEFRGYFFVTVFWKAITEVWRAHTEAYRRRFNGDERLVERRLHREPIQIPAGAEFDVLWEQRAEMDIGERINWALQRLEQANPAKLEGLFREIDFNSAAVLGPTRERNARLRRWLDDFSRVDMSLVSGAVLREWDFGTIFERLLERWVREKRRDSLPGVFDPGVNLLLRELMAPQKGERLCDPVCGCGTVLSSFGGAVPGGELLLFGQEPDESARMLCRMNLLLHGFPSFRVEGGDPLRAPRLLEADGLMKFDIVVAQPPSSVGEWGQEKAVGDRFGRFRRGIPPKSKADFAYLLHVVASLSDETGRAAVVVAAGVLFRGGSEREIRRHLIEEGLVEAVIELPAKIGAAGAPAAAVIVLRRKRPDTDVLFIGSGRQDSDQDRHPTLDECEVERMVRAYREGAERAGDCHRASLAELAANEFNLTVSQYLDRSDKGEEIDLADLKREIGELEKELQEVRGRMNRYLKDLGE